MVEKQAALSGAHLTHVSDPSASLEGSSAGDFPAKAKGTILLLKSTQVKGDLIS